MKLAIHFNDRAYTVVDNVTTFWMSEKSVHVRTSFEGFDVEHTFSRKVIIAIFEVEDDGRKERVL